jgi:hypothetical protein
MPLGTLYSYFSKDFLMLIGVIIQKIRQYYTITTKSLGLERLPPQSLYRYPNTNKPEH